MVTKTEDLYGLLLSSGPSHQALEEFFCQACQEKLDGLQREIPQEIFSFELSPLQRGSTLEIYFELFRFFFGFEPRLDRKFAKPAILDWHRLTEEKLILDFFGRLFSHPRLKEAASERAALLSHLFDRQKNLFSMLYRGEKDFALRKKNYVQAITQMAEKKSMVFIPQEYWSYTVNFSPFDVICVSQGAFGFAQGRTLHSEWIAGFAYQDKVHEAKTAIVADLFDPQSITEMVHRDFFDGWVPLHDHSLQVVSYAKVKVESQIKGVSIQVQLDIVPQDLAFTLFIKADYLELFDNKVIYPNTLSKEKGFAKDFFWKDDEGKVSVCFAEPVHFELIPLPGLPHYWGSHFLLVVPLSGNRLCLEISKNDNKPLA